MKLKQGVKTKVEEQKKGVESEKERQGKSFGWLIHLWPTAKRGSGEPDTKEGQCLDSIFAF